MKNSQIFWNVLVVIVQIAIAYYINICLVIVLQIIHLLYLYLFYDILDYFKYANISYMIIFLVALILSFLYDAIISIFSFLSKTINKFNNIIDSIHIKKWNTKL